MPSKGSTFLREKTADLEKAGFRLCRDCKIEKPLSSFYQYKNGCWRTRCLLCWAEQRKKWRSQVPGGYRAYNRANRQRRWYGLSAELFERMWKSQKGRCFICKRKLELRSGGFAIDHPHGTKLFRGLLCCPCNAALPIIEFHLKRALIYLGIKGAS